MFYSFMLNTYSKVLLMQKGTVLFGVGLDPHPLTETLGFFACDRGK